MWASAFFSMHPHVASGAPLAWHPARKLVRYTAEYPVAVVLEAPQPPTASADRDSHDYGRSLHMQVIGISVDGY